MAPKHLVSLTQSDNVRRGVPGVFLMKRKPCAHLPMGASEISGKTRVSKGIEIHRLLENLGFDSELHNVPEPCLIHIQVGIVNHRQVRSQALDDSLYRMQGKMLVDGHSHLAQGEATEGACRVNVTSGAMDGGNHFL